MRIAPGLDPERFHFLSSWPHRFCFDANEGYCPHDSKEKKPLPVMLIQWRMSILYGRPFEIKKYEQKNPDRPLRNI